MIVAVKKDGIKVSPGVVGFAGVILVIISALFGENHLLLLPGVNTLHYGGPLQLKIALLRVLIFAAAILLIRYRHVLGGRPTAGIRGDRPFIGRLLLTCIAWLLYRLISLFLLSTEGAVTIAVAGAAVLALAAAVRGAFLLLAEAAGSTRRWPLLDNLLITSASAVLLAVALEVLLGVFISWSPPSRGDEKSSSPPMPPELRWRDVEVEGAREAMYWQGILHVFNDDGVRVIGDFPAKEEDVFRVIAIGDSLTYGKGVEAAYTWPAVLDRELKKEFKAEVLNLGVCAANSEDILQILRKYTPLLEPDLVIYGVCINDFLPSWRGQYGNNLVWAVPFPHKAHFIERTILGELVARRYNGLLIKLGVRADYYDDILRDFEGYRERFAGDVLEMNRYTMSRGGAPVMAMVLVNAMATSGKAYDIAMAAEEYLRAAGMEVVPSSYIGTHAGRSLHVSPWEFHPSEEAHRIFAGEILKVVRERLQMREYQKE